MSEKYPIRAVMGECAESWNNRQEPISPFIAAAQFFAELKRRGLQYDTYLSTIITGGGHTHDPEIETAQAIDRNVRNGLSVADILYDEATLNPAHVAEPAAMPTIEGWLPDEWMTFWTLAIAKPDFTNVSYNRVKYIEQQFTHKIWERVNFDGLDMDKYRDRTIDKSERLLHYASHASAMHEVLRMKLVDINPVHRIIGLLGMEESVGSSAEDYFAAELGVHRFKAALAKVEALEPEQLSNTELSSNICRLRELGIHALSMAPSQQLILVENRAGTNWGMQDAGQTRLF